MGRWDGGCGDGRPPLVRPSVRPPVRPSLPHDSAQADSPHPRPLPAVQGGDARQRTAAGGHRASRAAGRLGDPVVPRRCHLRPAGQGGAVQPCRGTALQGHRQPQCGANRRHDRRRGRHARGVFGRRFPHDLRRRAERPGGARVRSAGRRDAASDVSGERARAGAHPGALRARVAAVPAERRGGTVLREGDLRPQSVRAERDARELSGRHPRRRHAVHPATTAAGRGAARGRGGRDRPAGAGAGGEGVRGLAGRAAAERCPSRPRHASGDGHPAGTPAGFGASEHRAGQHDHPPDRPHLLSRPRRDSGLGRRGGLAAVPDPARAEEARCASCSTKSIGSGPT